MAAGNSLRVPDRAVSDRGGYVEGFSSIFDPTGFALPEAEIDGLGRVFKWLLHVGREALRDAGIEDTGRTGAIIGNLSFPTQSMAHYAERLWLGDELADAAGLPSIDPRNRFASGYPAHLLARALGLGEAAWCLDAACASSLYAIKLASDRLHDGRAQTMLAGAVNAADDLLLHQGFTALEALSPSGRSRPFHRRADGLLPAEGAALLVLKRLEDAERDGHRILGVIRGVGLSNDGRRQGFLAPSREGQVRAIRAAYRQSGLTPESIGLVECHATGTVVGDTTEILSTGTIFEGCRDVPIGSLKSNIGHTVSVAGAAGLMKVLAAIGEGMRPPTLHAEEPIEVLATSPFRILTEPEPWPADEPRRAAVSAFGFGGNNAHLLVEEHVEAGTFNPAPPSRPGEPVALVGMGVLTGGASRVEALTGAVADRPLETVALPTTGLRFPPRDLEATLGQQLAVLRAAIDAVEPLGELPRDRTGVYVGMACDPEVARFGMRWRLAEWVDAWDIADPQWLRAARDAVGPPLTAAGLLGNLSNIPANRLNNHFDFRGPGFTTSAEELSGVRGLEVALRALRCGEIDAALVGATDLSCELVHRQALADLGFDRSPADAALVFVLKRLADVADEPVLAVFEADAEPTEDWSVDPQAGYPHAAFGLLQVTLAVLECRRTRRSLRVAIEALGGQRSEVTVSPPDRIDPLPERSERDQARRYLELPAHPPPVRLPPMPSPAIAEPLVPPMPAPDEPQLMAPAPFLTPILEAEEAPAPAPAPEPPRRPEAPAHGGVAGTPPVATRAQATSSAAPPGPHTASQGGATRAAEERKRSTAFRQSSPVGAPRPGSGNGVMAAAFTAQRAQLAHLAKLHRQFVEQQAEAHGAFLRLRDTLLDKLVQAGTRTGAPRLGVAPSATPQPTMARPATVAPSPAASSAAAVSELAPMPPAPAPAKAPPPEAVDTVEAVETAPAPLPTARADTSPERASEKATRSPTATVPPPTPQPPRRRRGAPPGKPPAAEQGPPPTLELGPRPPKVDPVPPEPVGLTLDRAQLAIHASGRISEVFGPLFRQQDGYRRQVRMPEPPLLLADRLTGLNAEPGSLGKGTLWTETDVRDDGWYLHDGRMPAGIMIEAGQADLMLISYLGIDFLNRSERVYRLLGCDLTYHAGLPEPGDTLCYDIHVDGYAKQGDIRLFFFNYDCRVDGAPRLSIRGGQAGFFSDAELDESLGVLWNPETGERCDHPRLDEPVARSQRSSFSRPQLEAFSMGRVLECFGPGFEKASTQTRPPRLQGGRMLLLEEVTHFEPAGGPWGRGYLRAVDAISPDDWFFRGHFKNDPCMPGTLMFEGCLQAMSVYLSALGFTLDNDGWRFEPVPDETYRLRCRGQCVPSSKELVYEVFVEELIGAPCPTLYADVLCTVDGLKAFHCRRLGLRLVPDFPLDSRPDLKSQVRERSRRNADAVARVDGFPFDYHALLACAWGRPTDAFGETFAAFDTGIRRSARLPGPPYHFMSRVLTLEGEIASMKAGALLELELDVPRDAWYFNENGAPTMPLCVIMEAALQPCGWLATYLGCTLSREESLFFRNLDGQGTLRKEVRPGSGPLRTRVRCDSLSQAGGMIIVSFTVESSLRSEAVFEMKSAFGFFPARALAAQVGLPTSDALRARLGEPSPLTVDLDDRPPRFFGGSARLAAPFLFMLSRVTGIWPEGGEAGLGRFRAERDIDPDDWYFKAHFHQDPVQPGSLGVEAMLQLLQFAMLYQGLDEGIEDPRFEPLALDCPLTWKYRGQVTVHNETVVITLDILDHQRDDRGVCAIAEASLWVDGMRIYETKNMGMRIVSGGATADATCRFDLDPERDVWLQDHCPTFVIPALPMMSMVDLMAQAAGGEGRLVTGLRGVKVKRWLVVDRPRSLRCRVRRHDDHSAHVVLADEEGEVAEGTVLLSTFWSTGPPSPRPHDAPPAPDPYEDGSLFHGPAFQRLVSWRLDETGASATIKAGGEGVPLGALNPVLLDATTHLIPHDRPDLWHRDTPSGHVAYPVLITEMDFFGPAPMTGMVRVEARADGYFGGPRFPATRIQVICEDDRVWATYRLVESVFPKGALGTAEPRRRRRFLRGREYVDGLALSSSDGAVTHLAPADVRSVNWLPGTVKAIYGTEDPAEIAMREHLAAKLWVHPSVALEATPYTRFPLDVVREGESQDSAIRVRDGGAEHHDLETVVSFWNRFSKWPRSSLPIDVFRALATSTMRRVVFSDPDTVREIRRRGTLFLANHQVGVESALLTILLSPLAESSVAVLAREEIATNWLGQMLNLALAYPGVFDPGVLKLVDRDNASAYLTVLAELRQLLRNGKHVLVHVEGEYALRAGHPVTKMSGTFVDLAIDCDVPVVPVRMLGGLPVEPVPQHLEFPFGMGRQDYWIGPPIEPDELRETPYAQRTARILSAINDLGPPLDDERPLPDDPELAAAVAAHVARTGVDPERAAQFCALRRLEDPSEETRWLLSETASEPPAHGQLARWLRTAAVHFGVAQKAAPEED